jgi:hypothetical protein
MPVLNFPEPKKELSLRERVAADLLRNCQLFQSKMGDSKESATKLFVHVFELCVDARVELECIKTGAGANS